MEDELDETEEEAEEEAEVAADVTHHARARERQAQALDLRGRGLSFDEIAAKCGYSHRSVARRAVMAACKAIAEDSAEEMRAAFKASYGPVRVALHRKARQGDVAAALALVKLDERECKLFGLDLAPADPALSQQYTKRIVLEEATPLQLVPSGEPIVADGHHNGQGEAIWTSGGHWAARTQD